MFQGINVFRLFAVQAGLLGIGATFDEATHEEQGAFVFSADGENWTVYAADPAVFPENIGINDLIEIENRYVGAVSAVDFGVPSAMVTLGASLDDSNRTSRTSVGAAGGPILAAGLRRS